MENHCLSFLAVSHEAKQKKGSAEKSFSGPVEMTQLGPTLLPFPYVSINDMISFT
jgi:hypothetical protein